MKEKIMPEGGCVRFSAERARELGDKYCNMPCFVIFNKPKDFPNNVVVRLFVPTVIDNEPVSMADSSAIVTSSVAEARRALPIAEMALMRVERDPEDDPSVVEIWF